MFSKINYNLDALLGKVEKRHPMLLYLAMLIGTPAFILLAVFICAYVILLPVRFLMGWL